MSFSYTNRRRLGRAPSPPTWAWYEQIPYEDDESDNTSSAEESCSEDEDDYHNDHASDSDHTAPPSVHGEAPPRGPVATHNTVPGTEDALNEKTDVVDSDKRQSECEQGVNEDDDSDAAYEAKKDIKGKQRATEPEVVEESPKRRERRKKHREHNITLRPILTIQKSQGFVWNQDLFVPPYIKDRYVASTSPPNAGGFFSANSSYEYEVDVVEIRVKEGEYADIIP